MDRQGPLVQGLSLAVTVLSVVDRGQIAQARADAEVVNAKHLLADRQGASKEGFGFGIASLPVEFDRLFRQLDGGCELICLIRRPFPGRSRTASRPSGWVEQGRSFAVAALGLVEDDKILRGDTWMVRAESARSNRQSPLIQGLGFAVARPDC